MDCHNYFGSQQLGIWRTGIGRNSTVKLSLVHINTENMAKVEHLQILQSTASSRLMSYPLSLEFHSVHKPEAPKFCEQLDLLCITMFHISLLMTRLPCLFIFPLGNNWELSIMRSHNAIYISYKCYLPDLHGELALFGILCVLLYHVALLVIWKLPMLKMYIIILLAQTAACFMLGDAPLSQGSNHLGIQIRGRRGKKPCRRFSSGSSYYLHSGQD